ncbi:L,D-transpeptidase [Streptomyces sp. NPDC047453]|uniref:L,D-transpeptidase n=1 Tax=Streptomyces sp. NPDC047453 TaxID=3154812 RepID=UPI0033F0EAFF
MNAKYRTSLRVAAATAASAGILSALGLAAPAGTAAAHDTRTTSPARPAQPLATAPQNALATGRTSTTPATRGYVLKFTKNWSRTDHSTLALYRDGRLVKRYRAGSGMGSTNECAKERGWLPSGTYKVLGHQTNRNGKIKGYAIHLADKACRPEGDGKPVTRGDLFIHSNMTKNGASRWHGNYKSYGCIKLAPADIKNLFAHLNKAHWPKNLTLQVS